MLEAMAYEYEMKMQALKELAEEIERLAEEIEQGVKDESEVRQ